MSIQFSSLSKNLQATILAELGGLSSLSSVIQPPHVSLNASKEELKKKVKKIEGDLFDLKEVSKKVKEITGEVKNKIDVSDIIAQVEEEAKKSKVDADDLDDAVTNIKDLQSSLESAVFGLYNLFKDKESDLRDQIDNLEYDIEELTDLEEQSE